MSVLDFGTLTGMVVVLIGAVVAGLRYRNQIRLSVPGDAKVHLNLDSTRRIELRPIGDSSGHVDFGRLDFESSDLRMSRRLLSFDRTDRHLLVTLVGSGSEVRLTRGETTKLLKRGRSRRLSTGDRIELGRHAIVVEIRSTTSTTYFESYGLSDTGKSRAQNQDAYSCSDSLLCVADGVGSSTLSALASALAIERISTSDRSLDRVKGAILDLDVEVKRKAIGATTCTAVFLAEGSADECLCVNVGDSPAFILGKEGFKRLDTPHSLIGPNDPVSARQRQELEHVLTQAIGLGREPRPAWRRFRIHVGDTILVCSDGLTRHVSESEIARILQIGNPPLACDTLVKLALDRGGEDNVTVVVARVRQR
jgi:serine/threonine protein phosphatase PrpC